MTPPDTHSKKEPFGRGIGSSGGGLPMHPKIQHDHSWHRRWRIMCGVTCGVVSRGVCGCVCVCHVWCHGWCGVTRCLRGGKVREEEDGSGLPANLRTTLGRGQAFLLCCSKSPPRDQQEGKGRWGGSGQRPPDEGGMGDPPATTLGFSVCDQTQAPPPPTPPTHLPSKVQ